MNTRLFFVASWFLTTGFFVLPSTADSASLYIDPAFQEMFRGDTITLAVRLDVDEQTGECINAVDAIISYPANIEPVDTSIGDSILRVWVEEPTINKDERTITFAGGIPNGYCGRVVGDPRLTNVLAEIVFRSPGLTIGSDATDDSVANVSFAPESTAYLNDGRGTKASLSTYSAKVTLNDKPGAEQLNSWKVDVQADNIKPEEFSIELQKDSKAFSQQYYVVFSTVDKQTGIDHYEIMEEPLSSLGAFAWGRADVPWETVTSPHILKDQSLKSTIRVKAVDKAGNEQIAVLIPSESDRSSASSMIGLVMVVTLGVAVLLIGWLAWFVWRRRTARKLVERKSDEESI